MKRQHTDHKNIHTHRVIHIHKHTRTRSHPHTNPNSKQNWQKEDADIRKLNKMELRCWNILIISIQKVCTFTTRKDRAKRNRFRTKKERVKCNTEA